MEPFAKRQRLCSPARRAFPQSYDQQRTYYDQTADDEILEDEEEFEEEAEDPPNNDSELGARRARLDFKLKSTFEAIFDKYGKDFEGIGDEIDLETGEILVDNGHLAEMKNERDAGDPGRSRRALRDVADDHDDIPRYSQDETDMLDEEDEDDDEEDLDEEEESTSEDEQVDDDMILRGFTQANRFIQAVPERRPRPESVMLRQEQRQLAERRLSAHQSSLPSRSEILAQFGPQLGPEIVNYVSERQIPDDSHIEPAWRVPEIPALKSSKQPSMKAFTLPPEPERSPSPETAPSIWAQPGTRRRRKSKGAKMSAVYIDEGGAAPSHYHRSTSLDPLSDPFNFDSNHISSPMASRHKFTAQDDQILQTFVAEAKRQNLELLSRTTWAKLEHKYPHHSWSRWKERYKAEFTYLWPGQTDDSDISTSETSLDTTKIYQPNSDIGQSEALPPPRPPFHDRAPRIRKPAQKDSRIISWSQAVDAIETIDPELHAGILEDTAMMESAGQMTQEVSSSFGNGIGLPNHEPGLVSSTSLAPEIRKSTTRDLDSFSDLAPVDSTPLPENNIPRASCPHVDCQKMSSQLYRLQRRDGEDLSEMCLHLFHTHHTTPYPCSEPACSRKGTEGFFMQADLVRHVRIFHKSLAALQRLRGRVDEDLLNRHLRPGSSQAEHQLDTRQSDKQVESDFMASFDGHNTRFASSNANASSSSSADRTLTPRMTAGPSGPSESTPMTSLSSLLVHHPSETRVELRSESRPHDLQYPVVGIRETREKMDESLQSASSLTGDHAYGSIRHSPRFERPRDLSDPFVVQPDKSSLTSPRTSARSLVAVVVANGSDATTVELDSVESCEPVSEEALKNTIVPNTERQATFPRQISDSQSSAATIPSSSLPQQSKPEAAATTKASSSFRTNIDASYDFSDDEEGITSILKPSTAAGHTPQPILTSTNVDVDMTDPVASEKVLPPTSVLPSATAICAELPAVPSSASVDDSRSHSASRSYLPSQRSVMRPPITPASRIPRMSVAPKLLDDDDFDELSMLGDEFALQSSIPKPQLKHKTLARHRANIKGPSSVPSKSMNISKRATAISETAPVPGKKRTIDDFRSGQASSSKTGQSSKAIPPSSHKAVTTTGSSASKSAALKAIDEVEPVIKTEADDTTPTLPRRRGRPPKNHVEPVPVPPNPAQKESLKPAKRGRPRVRAKTPLLDLTPRRAAQQKGLNKEEVADSAAESSSPLAGVATPIRLKASFQHPLESGHALPVIRTPGGSWRRCGEGGMECKNAFCFRCTKKAEASRD